MFQSGIFCKEWKLKKIKKKIIFLFPKKVKIKVYEKIKLVWLEEKITNLRYIKSHMKKKINSLNPSLSFPLSSNLMNVKKPDNSCLIKMANKNYDVPTKREMRGRVWRARASLCFERVHKI